MVASKPEIGAIERAKKHGIQTITFDKSAETKDEFYTRVAGILKAAGVEYVVLAGWLLVVPAAFIKEFENAIVNIHPSLIPAFCGMGYYGLKVHKAAIEYGVKLSGATVHFVEADDTPESLQARILKEEHVMLPECVKLLCEGKIVKEGRTVRIVK